METGQPFLMPNKNKILNNNDLSVHIFMDGFYFCTQSKIEFIPLLEDSQDFHKTLRKTTENMNTYKVEGISLGFKSSVRKRD